ncbi:iron ABC transporter permease [Ammoniphilus sp. YIM 78166]|uniref:FecCD family ABC transporter permease n=1 Tax=Ammoniphilus sp. YIM 78166 TaxID=1644106 RepID=UPI001070236D|nr:iron ABC transporter permease [Ammoniphilus sp. YIM 78166]
MSIQQANQKLVKKRLRILAILLALILLSFVVSINLGQIYLDPVQLFKTLFGLGTAKEELILFEFRLPRIMISILIGMGLAVAGCILQGVSRNELADPGILGLNQGAGLMIVIYISFFQTQTVNHLIALPIAAFVGSAFTAFLVYVFSYRKNEGIDPTRMVLVGVGLAAAISGAMIIFTVRLRPEEFQFIAKWLSGHIWGKDWNFVLVLLPWILILLPLAYSKAKILDLLNLGDKLAVGLGLNIQRERIYLLLIAVGLAASCVSVSGMIAFVGLIAPHLARRLVGSNHAFLIPGSALIGALLVLNADTIARMILQPSGIPTGIVVAILGAPYFVYLLIRVKG